MTGRRGWRPRRRARSADVSARASCGILTCYSWVPLSVLPRLGPYRALAPLPQHLAGTWCHWAGGSGKTECRLIPAGCSAAADGGGVGQLPREAQQLPHGVLAVGGLADPQREVVGRDCAQVPVIGVAVLVAAVGRLEFQVG